jgi:hypothetical protein
LDFAANFFGGAAVLRVGIARRPAEGLSNELLRLYI